MYTNHIHTILVLWYLTSALILGMYHTLTSLLHRMEKATPVPATTMDESFGGADMDHWTYSYALGMDWTMFPALVDMMETYTSPWEDEIYAQQLNNSIARYEEEMDMEWEDEIMGYTLSDIVTFMVLDSEDDPYQDLPFTASMIRSAKPGKRGIVVKGNSSANRSCRNHNDKDRR